MFEQITLRDLREMFTDAEPDTVLVKVQELNPVVFARVDTPRTSVAVER